MITRSAPAVIALLLPALMMATHRATAQDARIPLTDLGSGVYRGVEGGLYPGGANVPPAAHLGAGAEALARILPRDRSSAVDTVAGRIVLLSIGMSNATQEFSAFKQLADADTMRSGRVVIVDGAQGGQTAAIIASDTAQFWRVVDARLEAAGVTPAQVQVAWLKEANARPTGSFPGHADTLSRQLERIVSILAARYPNIASVYLSSRTYGGYATTTLNPEPYAYESGFAVKWLIERQIDGAVPGSPWLAWGPYLWADGLNPRGDGLIWERGDFVADGTHPSTSGRAKVAGMLLAFFRGDTLARQWYLRRPGERPFVPAPAAPTLTSPADSSIAVIGTVDLTWRAPAGAVDRYLLEVIGPGGYQLVDSSLTTTTYRWRTPARVGLYQWRVRAGNEAGWGPPTGARRVVLQTATAVEEERTLPERLDFW